MGKFRVSGLGSLGAPWLEFLGLGYLACGETYLYVLGFQTLHREDQSGPARPSQGQPRPARGGKRNAEQIKEMRNKVKELTTNERNAEHGNGMRNGKME